MANCSEKLQDFTPGGETTRVNREYNPRRKGGDLRSLRGPGSDRNSPETPGEGGRSVADPRMGNYVEGLMPETGFAKNWVRQVLGTPGDESLEIRSEQNIGLLKGKGN